MNNLNLDEIEDESIFGGDDDDEEDDADSSVSAKGSVKEAREDIKLMNIVRAIVILFLLTVAFIVAETVFVIAIVNEEANFQEGYERAADQLISSFFREMETTLWVAKTFSTEISSDASGPWPFVTVPDFESRCEGPAHTSKSTMISLNPLITAEELLIWELYARSTFPANSVAESASTTDNVLYFPTMRSIKQGLYRFQNGTALSLEQSHFTVHFPMWQVYPSLGNESTGLMGTLFDETSNPIRKKAISDMNYRMGSVLSNFLFQDTNHTDFANYSNPRSSLYYPVLNGTRLVASINMELEWNRLFEGALDSSFQNPILVVVTNSCGGNFTFNVTGQGAAYVAEGDLHTPTGGNNKVIRTSPDAFAHIFDIHGQKPLDLENGCNFEIAVYPSPSFYAEYQTWKPEGYRAIVLGSFMMITFVFLLYDGLIERRQHRVVAAAERSDAIVRSLFPENIRDKLYENARKKEEHFKNVNNDNWHNTDHKNHNGKGILMETQRKKIKKFVNDGDPDSQVYDEPIADLFPQTTILFADIAGFTAWSSEREPSQVFQLLETIYHSMDRSAKKFGVFKVETVGDCYVAATGIPQPQARHAEIMVRFAQATCVKIQELTRSLETHLGPGTADLGMRYGLHSGPVTAGVLRGQKARFQLFGDTMNMAARIESLGMKNKIHVSEETAQILIKSGKGHWIIPREDRVHAKGKGSIRTYWIRYGTSTASNVSSSDQSSNLGCSVHDSPAASPSSSITEVWRGTTLEKYLGKTKIDEKLDRLIDWNLELLFGLLKSVVAKRVAGGEAAASLPSTDETRFANDLAVDEIQLVISLPDFDADVAAKAADEVATIELSAEVKSELRLYIAAIATGYRDNEFHNFEHASHVILSANKLLKRIVSVDDDKYRDMVTSQDVHEHTYGIGTDPLTQFAMVFSALVHDVCHTGVPNSQAVAENPDLAEKYNFRSIAEQHSIKVAWELLMLPAFANLRGAIYQNQDECERFRHLLVNSVMATDIFDKDLKAIRTLRWDQAFHVGLEESPITAEKIHRKATIVIEHVIQASDVSHTMQHWYIYQKWNERLFQEMFLAHVSKRSTKDPSEGWYEGEIWFFDNYVIPLAYKLKECGVFGASGDEYLTYAVLNRNEWEQKGCDIVENMRQRAMTKADKLGLIRLLPVEETGDSSSGAVEEPDIVTFASPIMEAGQRMVLAPPGKLGIVLDLSLDSSGHFVYEVQSGSPLEGKLKAGDRIIGLDGIATNALSSEAFAALIEVSAKHSRMLVVAE